MSLFKFIPGYTRKIINAEIANGACFDVLELPINSLSKFKIIQFRSGNPLEAAGLGASMQLDNAYKISFFEYLERKSFFENGIKLGFKTTNGLALHKFVTLAKESALSEAYERDAFLLHWYTKTPFKEIPSDLYPNFIDDLKNDLEQIGYELKIGETFLGEKRTIISTLINSRTGGFVLGLSSGRSIHGDILKSILEASINLFFGDCGVEKDAQIQRIQKNGVRNLADHRALWFYVNELPNWFFSKLKTDVQRKKTNISIEDFVLTRFPFPVVAIRSPKLLDLPVGQSNGGLIQTLMLRLHNISESNLWIHPHPIP